MVNTKFQDRFFIVLGVIGGLILLFGLFQYSPQVFYVLGSIFLLLTALYFKLLFFGALELVLIAGHGAILLDFNNMLKTALPIFMSLQLLFFYVFSGQLNNIFLFVGILGISMLSIGFAYQNQWVFFFGGIAIAIYAFYTTYQGQRVTLIWAILNILFALTAVYKLIF